MTREAWLMAATEEMRAWILEHGCALPERVRVSCGWPSKSALSRNRRTLGQAWSPAASKDGTCETFISPYLADPVRVGDVLLHELVHHAVGTACGHRGPFKRLATALGLQGKMTATVAGPELKVRLHALSEKLGPYPHAVLDASARPKQGTRMLKVTCPDCGCVARMAQKWIDDAGVPTCACGGQMKQE